MNRHSILSLALAPLALLTACGAPAVMPPPAARTLRATQEPAPPGGAEASALAPDADHAGADPGAAPLEADEAARLALARSGDLRALELELRAAQERSGVAGALPDPSVHLALEAQPLQAPREGEEWLAGISQEIPLGAARAGQREAGQAAVRLAAARRDAATRDVEQRVRALHAAGLAQEAALALLRERRSFALARIARADARVAAGDASPAAQDAARLDAALIEHELEDALHARAAQVRALAALIGPADARRQPVGSLEQTLALPELSELMDRLDGLPAMREAEAAAALAAARAQVAGAERLPLLRFDAGWRERADGRGSVDLGLGFTLPWSGAAGGRARASEFEAAAQRDRVSQTERDLARRVADAHDAAVLAQHRLEIFDEAVVPAAEKHLARARARAAAGDAAGAAVDEAADALASARLARLRAWAELAAAYAELGALLLDGA